MGSWLEEWQQWFSTWLWLARCSWRPGVEQNDDYCPGTFFNFLIR